MADEKLNTDPAENISPEAAEPITTPEEAAASEPQQEQTGPSIHKVPPKRDYGRYFCIMAEKGGTSHGGLTEKLSPFFHAKKQEVNAYGR